MDYKAAVFIGRFQPFHDEHMSVIMEGFRIAEQVVVVVGSVNASPNIKNPFTFEERKQMILERYGDSRPLHIVGVRDHYYSDNTWVAEIQAKTSPFFDEGDSVAIIGSYKDSSSSYLSSFPQWDFHPIRTQITDASAIRERLFREEIKTDWEGKPTTASVRKMDELIEAFAIPDTTRGFLKEFVQTPRFAQLSDEWHFINKYKSAWASAPFPVTFNTVDAIVVCSGHVLVVKRKLNPGKGLYALPGGFLKGNEFPIDGAIRELREETKIDVDKIILKSSIVSNNVFAHPDRSLRGRTITHAYYIRLKDGKLPNIKASDDAEEALWMPLNDVARNENRFYEDHAHMIHFFINNS